MAPLEELKLVDFGSLSGDLRSASKSDPAVEDTANPESRGLEDLLPGERRGPGVLLSFWRAFSACCERRNYNYYYYYYKTKLI